MVSGSDEIASTPSFLILQVEIFFEGTNGISLYQKLTFITHRTSIRYAPYPIFFSGKDFLILSSF